VAQYPERTKMTYVPYKGSAPAIADLVAAMST
jgi:tripartite-type tricarboxylate transporter receptor subunit TctC